MDPALLCCGSILRRFDRMMFNNAVNTNTCLFTYPIQLWKCLIFIMIRQFSKYPSPGFYAPRLNFKTNILLLTTEGWTDFSVVFVHSVPPEKCGQQSFIMRRNTRGFLSGFFWGWNCGILQKMREAAKICGNWKNLRFNAKRFFSHALF